MDWNTDAWGSHDEWDEEEDSYSNDAMEEWDESNDEDED